MATNDKLRFDGKVVIVTGAGGGMFIIEKTSI
jgi:hypothetical protein